jgi:hypothetical protein
MADISFRNVALPSFGSALAGRTGIDAVNKGINSLRGLVTDYEDQTNQQTQNQQDIDVTKLRTLADEQLGGRLAGESVEDYDSNINAFLAQNQDLVGDIGVKALDKFRTDFEKNLTTERDTRESRDITLEQRERSKVIRGREDAAFERTEKLRESRLGARNHLAGYQQEQDLLLARSKKGDPLSTEELIGLNNTQSINDLETELLTQFPDLPLADIQQMIQGRSERVGRLVQTAQQKTALANARRDEQRAYDASIATLANDRKFNLEEYKRLAEFQHQRAPTDILGGEEDLITALTLKNGGLAPSDDILEEMRPIIAQYVQEGVHISDVVNALVLSTEAKDEILTFDIDETLQDPDKIPSLIAASAAGQEFLARQKQYERLGGNSGAATTPPAGGSGASTPVPAAESTVLENPGNGPAAGVPLVDTPAPAPSTVPAPLSAAETAAELQLVPPLEAKSVDELKAVAINQLNAEELPVVQANLEEALAGIPNALQSPADEREENHEDRLELKDKIEEIEDLLGRAILPTISNPTAEIRNQLPEDVQRLIEQSLAQQSQ